MPIRYYKLFDYLNRYGMKKTDLITKADISAPTLAKLSKGDSINTNIIDKICAALGVQPSDIMEYVSIDCNYKVGDVFKNISLFSDKEIELHNSRVKKRIKRLTENLSKEMSTENQPSEITEQMLKEVLLKLSSYDFINEEIDMKKYAKELNLSYSRFAHMFTDQIGISPHKYILQYRIFKAAELLMTSSLNVSEISENVGFQDSLYFSRMFRKHMGMSPTEYRHVSRHSR